MVGSWLLSAGVPSEADCLNSLVSLMAELDSLLDCAVAAARDVFGQEAAANPRFRGLYITESEVQRLLHPGTAGPAHRSNRPGPDEAVGTAREVDGWVPAIPEGSRLAWLQRTFGLDGFDLAVVAIALAPEFDLRYERIYAYLQDDVTRKRPTVDLALSLLCSSVQARLRHRDHFGPEAPLLRHTLLRLVPDAGQIQPPLLAHSLRLDEQVVWLLLGQAGLDPRLASTCRKIEATATLDESPLDFEAKRALPALVLRARQRCEPLRVYFRGSEGAGQQATAVALAAIAGTPLLVADLARGLGVASDFSEWLRLVFREAWLLDAVLYLDGIDTIRAPEQILCWRALLDALDSHKRVTLLAGALPWATTGQAPWGVLEVPFPVPDVPRRRTAWLAALSAESSDSSGSGWDVNRNGVANRVVDDLAAQFRLMPSQIAGAVATARIRALWREAARSSGSGNSRQTEGSDEKASFPLDARELFAAARSQSGHDLAALACKVVPRHGWEDLVLPSRTTDQLREICDQARHGEVVYSRWGFGRKLSLGKGLNVLLCGVPGTGKTMAAEIIAGELGLDLYKIDLSRVVSKYIGDTEKNLDCIFHAAESSNAVLHFEEADTLCGKRSPVKDAHDRYANIEVGYLLQKMEEYEGIAILSTNLRSNMDEAFTRRLRFIVEFPFPEEPDRHRIWEVHFPPEAPRDGDIDLAFLARQFRIAGGNIRNIVLNASFLAAAAETAIGMRHLLRATRRELAKMGRDCPPAEFGPYLHLVDSQERPSSTTR